MQLHDSMRGSLISSLAKKVDQLQFADFDEEPMRIWLIPHPSQRVSLRRTQDLTSVQVRMRKMQQDQMISPTLRQQLMNNQQG